MKPFPAGDRSVVLRLHVPAVTWHVFRRKRDLLHHRFPHGRLPPGDAGIRLLLKVWLEELLHGRTGEGILDRLKNPPPVG